MRGNAGEVPQARFIAAWWAICAPLMDVFVLKGTGIIPFAPVVKPFINFALYLIKKIL